MNLLNPTVNMVLPFGQLAGLIAITWLAMVSYRVVTGMVAWRTIDRVQEAEREARTRLGIVADRKRDHGSRGHRDSADDCESFSAHEGGTW